MNEPQERREKYAHVNGQWPEAIPPLTPDEALAAAKRLYRKAMGRAWKGKWALTSGRRYTWPRRGVYFVNHTGHAFGGWRDLVHDLSHYAHRQLNAGKKGFKPHDLRHHFIERELVAHVVASGWLDGTLKREPKPDTDPRRERAARVAKRIKAWEAKRKRADTALRKLRTQAAYYARQGL